MSVRHLCRNSIGRHSTQCTLMNRIPRYARISVIRVQVTISLGEELLLCLDCCTSRDCILQNDCFIACHRRCGARSRSCFTAAFPGLLHCSISIVRQQTWYHEAPACGSRPRVWRGAYAGLHFISMRCNVPTDPNRVQGGRPTLVFTSIDSGDLGSKALGGSAESCA